MTRVSKIQALHLASQGDDGAAEEATRELETNACEYVGDLLGLLAEAEATERARVVAYIRRVCPYLARADEHGKHAEYLMHAIEDGKHLLTTPSEPPK